MNKPHNPLTALATHPPAETPTFRFFDWLSSYVVWSVAYEQVLAGPHWTKW